MKVPSLQLYSKFIIQDKDGKEYELNDNIITGCWEMCFHLKNQYGIETVPSTVYNGKKKFIPVTFPFGRTKEYYLAFFNWCINFKKEDRCEFFDNELDKSKFYENNPIVDFHIVVKKSLNN